MFIQVPKIYVSLFYKPRISSARICCVRAVFGAEEVGMIRAWMPIANDMPVADYYGAENAVVAEGTGTEGVFEHVVAAFVAYEVLIVWWQEQCVGSG